MSSSLHFDERGNDDSIGNENNGDSSSPLTPPVEGDAVLPNVEIRAQTEAAIVDHSNMFKNSVHDGITTDEATASPEADKSQQPDNVVHDPDATGVNDDDDNKNSSNQQGDLGVPTASTRPDSLISNVVNGSQTTDDEPHPDHFSSDDEDGLPSMRLTTNPSLDDIDAAETILQKLESGILDETDLVENDVGFGENDDENDAVTANMNTDSGATSSEATKSAMPVPEIDSENINTKNAGGPSDEPAAVVGKNTTTSRNMTPAKALDKKSVVEDSNDGGCHCRIS